MANTVDLRPLIEISTLNYKVRGAQAEAEAACETAEANSMMAKYTATKAKGMLDGAKYENVANVRRQALELLDTFGYDMKVWKTKSTEELRAEADKKLS